MILLFQLLTVIHYLLEIEVEETKEKELGKHVFIAPQTTGSLPNVVDHIIAYSVNDIQTVEFVENRSIWESKAIKFRPTKLKKYYDDGRNNGQD